jgi:hypothetical protein
MAEITFADGAVALLEGPAELELLGTSAAFLHRGQVVLHLAGPAPPFTLETLAARVVDDGTEFGVKVGGGGETEVQVFAGKVMAEIKGDVGPLRQHHLEGGQAVRIEAGPPAETRELTFRPDQFIRYLPGPDDPRGRGVYPYNRGTFDAVHIVPAPANLIVDGDLSDWDLSGRFRSECENPYGATYYVEGAMMHDHRFLYIGAHIGDPFPMRSKVSPHVQQKLYGQGGSLAVRLSADRGLGWPARGESRGAKGNRPLDAWDVNDKLTHLVMWHFQEEQLACLHIFHGLDLHGTRVNPSGYRGAYRMDPDGKGYTLEYAIDWSLLNAAEDPPQAGDILAATWVVHWSDPEGKVWKGQLVDIKNPAEHGWSFQRAPTWGRAIYHAAGPLPLGTVKPLP